MLPDTDGALKELAIAEELNLGTWVQHSRNVGIAARKIAERVAGLTKHVWEGYCYCWEMSGVQLRGFA